MKASQHYHEFWLGFGFGAFGIVAFLIFSEAGGWLCCAR